MQSFQQSQFEPKGKEEKKRTKKPKEKKLVRKEISEEEQEERCKALLKKGAVFLTNDKNRLSKFISENNSDHKTLRLVLGVMQYWRMQKKEENKKKERWQEIFQHVVENYEQFFQYLEIMDVVRLYSLNRERHNISQIMAKVHSIATKKLCDDFNGNKIKSVSVDLCVGQQDLEFYFHSDLDQADVYMMARIDNRNFMDILKNLGTYMQFSNKGIVKTQMFDTDDAECVITFSHMDLRKLLGRSSLPARKMKRFDIEKQKITVGLLVSEVAYMASVIRLGNYTFMAIYCLNIICWIIRRAKKYDRINFIMDGDDDIIPALTSIIRVFQQEPPNGHYLNNIIDHRGEIILHVLVAFLQHEIEFGFGVLGPEMTANEIYEETMTFIGLYQDRMEERGIPCPDHLFSMTFPQCSYDSAHCFRDDNSFSVQYQRIRVLAPVQAPAPVQAQVPAQGQVPVQAQAQVQGQAPVQAQAQVQAPVQAPVQAQAQVQAQAPVQGQAQAPAQGQAQGQAPVQAQAPAPAHDDHFAEISDTNFAADIPEVFGEITDEDGNEDDAAVTDAEFADDIPEVFGEIIDEADEVDEDEDDAVDKANGEVKNNLN